MTLNDLVEVLLFRCGVMEIGTYRTELAGQWQPYYTGKLDLRSSSYNLLIKQYGNHEVGYITKAKDPYNDLRIVLKR